VNTSDPSQQPSLWDESSEVFDEVLVISNTDLSTVEIRRSARRKKSVSAYRENGKTIVVVPARMAQRDIDSYVRDLVGRLDARDHKTASIDELERRARQLVKRYMDHDVIGTHRVPVTIKWVTNQNSRWGSCSPADGNIRLSHRLREMPGYVIDCVLLHELIHLVVPDHSDRFYAFMNRFEELEKASAYLDGYSHAERRLS
jgi:predicted metal-dependent hydrolase